MNMLVGELAPTIVARNKVPAGVHLSRHGAGFFLKRLQHWPIRLACGAQRGGGDR